MKKLICSLGLAFGIGSVAMAQTQSGKIFIGANLGWNNNENIYNYTNNTGQVGLRTNENSSFSIQPMIGAFVANNIALGIFVTYGNNRNKTTFPIGDYNENIKNDFLTVGPFIRKFFPLNDKFAIYGQGNLGYRRSSYNTNQESEGMTYNLHNKYNGIMAALKPGIVFFASKKVGVDLSVHGLQYSYSKLKNSRQSISNLDANFDLPSLNIGLNLYLGQ